MCVCVCDVLQCHILETRIGHVGCKFDCTHLHHRIKGHARPHPQYSIDMKFVSHLSQITRILIPTQIFTKNSLKKIKIKTKET